MTETIHLNNARSKFPVSFPLPRDTADPLWIEIRIKFYLELDELIVLKSFHCYKDIDK